MDADEIPHDRDPVGQSVESGGTMQSHRKVGCSQQVLRPGQHGNGIIADCRPRDAVSVERIALRDLGLQTQKDRLVPYGWTTSGWTTRLIDIDRRGSRSPVIDSSGGYSGHGPIPSGHANPANKSPTNARSKPLPDSTASVLNSALAPTAWLGNRHEHT